MARPGSKPSKAVPTLPDVYRRTPGLSRLNAAYIDLDIYKAETLTTVEQTIDAVMAMTEQGDIPVPSIIVRSGRGVWLLWLLIDPSTGLPPVAGSASVRLHQEIERGMQPRFAPFGADPAAKDAARVMRVPGSVHGGTGQRVSFHPETDQAGEMPLYTLPQLATAFRITSQPDRPTPTRPPAPAVHLNSPTGKRRSKRGGWTPVYRARLRQFRKLERLRGGYREGCRNHAALLLAVFLYRLRVREPEIMEQVYEFGGNCGPPLSERECKRAVSSAMTGKYQKFLNDTISDWLDIAPDEARQLKTWKAATRFPRPKLASKGQNGSRRDRRELREQQILSLISQHGGEVLSSRRLAQLLKKEGHQVTHTTVWKDMKRMKLVDGGDGGHGSSIPPTPEPLQAA